MRDQTNISEENCYQIADLTARIFVRHPRCLRQLEKYRCQEPVQPLLQISVTQEMIDAYCEAGKDSPEIQGWSKEQLYDEVEYMLAGSLFYRALTEQAGMLIHSSALVAEGRAWLFSGRSGVGKSTHTGLWQQHFGDAVYILNDDKPAVRLVEGSFYAYGTPWSGKTNLNVNRKVPLGGIVFLAQAQENRICRMEPTEAFPALFEQTVRNLSGEQMADFFVTADQLLQEIPVWRLECSISQEAVKKACQALGIQY